MSPVLDPRVNPGARPASEETETAAAEHVREIFNSIAPSYDLLNHLLSVGLDRRWWNRAARSFRTLLAQPDAHVLDLCCGTGDMTFALLKLRPAVAEPIIGLDFSARMLTRASAKFPAANARWVEGDAMQLPYPDSSFDLITAAFGFRNLTNYAGALAEIHRVLRPGGRVGILECNQPAGLRGLLYNLHLHHILPLVGGMISGDRAAYRYLPASIARFPRPPQMIEMLTNAGFASAAWDGYFLQAAGLYRGAKP